MSSWRSISGWIHPDPLANVATISKADRIVVMANRIKVVFGIVAIALSLMGLVTFSLFIHEEAFQTVMFSTWAAKDAQRWDIVKESCDLGQDINDTMKTVNKWFGWIQPFSLQAYGSYGDAADQYVKSLRAEVFAHHPELFAGEVVTIKFKPTSSKALADGRTELTNGRMFVRINSGEYSTAMLREGVNITGTVNIDGNRVILEDRGVDESK